MCLSRRPGRPTSVQKAVSMGARLPHTFTYHCGLLFWALGCHIHSLITAVYFSDSSFLQKKGKEPLSPLALVFPVDSSSPILWCGGGGCGMSHKPGGMYRASVPRIPSPPVSLLGSCCYRLGKRRVVYTYHITRPEQRMLVEYVVVWCYVGPPAATRYSPYDQGI